MGFLPSLCRFVLILVLTASEAHAHSSNTCCHQSRETVPHANHIFNAVRGAMRQWDSSWNHNGMSIFRAHIPEKVLLYHGRGDQEVVTGMEWLAFEPEHAILFARRMPRHPPSPSPPPKPPSPTSAIRDERGGERTDALDGRLGRRRRGVIGPDQSQRLLGNTEPGNPLPRPSMDREDSTGYLQHYRTSHALNLLYIDGMSAGKTNKGTLDTQDYLLLSNASMKPSSPYGDLTRALGLCELAQTTLAGGHIDGFIRMECGFEILLCRFEGNVDLERTQAVQNEQRKDEGKEKGHDDDDDDEEKKKKREREQAQAGFRLYKAVSDRFSGIGGGRVRVDLDDFVTAYSTNLDLFEYREDSGEMMPRLWNVSEPDLAGLADDVTRMVLRSNDSHSSRNEETDGKANDVYGAHDWQGIADLFVQRYARPLQALVLPGLSNVDFHLELAQLLRSFVSDGSTQENVERAAERCTNQFLPPSWNQTFAGTAIQNVGSRLCTTLISALANITSTSSTDAHERKERQAAYTTSRKAIADLITWLTWPVWHECSPGCAVDEVCVIPIWPITGSLEDRKSPRCKNATQLARDEGFGIPGFGDYWGNPGFPGRQPPSRDERFREEHLWDLW